MRRQPYSIRRKAASHDGGALAPLGRLTGAAAAPHADEVLNAHGRPLDEQTRALTEPRVGHDFSKVRIHADGQAAESARSSGARAFTVGKDFHLEVGQFAPVLRTGPVLARQTAGDAPQAADVGTPAAAELAEPSGGGGGTPKGNVEAVESGGKSYVLYPTKVRFDGSSAWLANNPGNMDYTENTKRWGCYEGVNLKWGKHRFAIFPDEDTGLAAVESFLRMFQAERDIRLMMNLFAPASDKNDPASYAARVAAKLKVPETTLVKTMSDEQLVIFALAIQEVEGWHVGTEKPRGDSALPEDVRRR